MKRHIALVLLILYSITVRGMDLNFPFTSLPTELQDRILIRITQDLDQPEYDLQMLTACRQVCKRWNEELSDQYFFGVLALPEEKRGVSRWGGTFSNNVVRICSKALNELRYGKLFFLIKKHRWLIDTLEQDQLSLWISFFCIRSPNVVIPWEKEDVHKYIKGIHLLTKQGLKMERITSSAGKKPLLALLLQMIDVSDERTDTERHDFQAVIKCAVKYGASQENLSQTERATLETLLAEK